VTRQDEESEKLLPAEVGKDKAEYADQFSDIEGVPHEAVWPALHKLSRLGNDTEASSKSG
jgi:hypothetical protein